MMTRLCLLALRGFPFRAMQKRKSSTRSANFNGSCTASTIPFHTKQGGKFLPQISLAEKYRHIAGAIQRN